MTSFQSVSLPKAQSLLQQNPGIETQPALLSVADVRDPRGQVTADELAQSINQGQVLVHDDLSLEVRTGKLPAVQPLSEAPAVAREVPKVVLGLSQVKSPPIRNFDNMAAFKASAATGAFLGAATGLGVALLEAGDPIGTVVSTGLVGTAGLVAGGLVGGLAGSMADNIVDNPTGARALGAAIGGTASLALTYFFTRNLKTAALAGSLGAGIGLVGAHSSVGQRLPAP